MTRVEKGIRESAVSPVVGVLLMLVVTIIIAAVVSGFAGGLAGTQKNAPSAAVGVKIDSTSGATTFEMLSGDALSTGNLKIITSYTLSNGTVVKHEQSKASPTTSLWGGYTTSRVPFNNDMAGYGDAGNTDAWFGNCSFKTGDILSTASWDGTTTLLGMDLTSAANRAIWGFKGGSQVEVKILDIPSNKFLFDKVVSVV